MKDDFISTSVALDVQTHGIPREPVQELHKHECSTYDTVQNLERKLCRG